MAENKEIFIRIVPQDEGSYYIQTDYHGPWQGDTEVITALDLAKGSIVQKALQNAGVKQQAPFSPPPWLKN